MGHIKLFEEFILETSSKRLEDIHSAIKKMMGDSSEYTIEFILYYILCAYVSTEKLEEVGKEYDNFRINIIRHKEFKFDMDEAIEHYKKVKEYNRGHISTGIKYSPFKEEDEYDKKALESIENILDYYKKKKNVDSVDYHTFVEYIIKAEKLMYKTNKNSELSINNILNTILKNGIDVISMEKELRKLEKERRQKDKLEILTNVTLKAGDEFEGDDRHNDYNVPVFQAILWNDKDYHYQVRLTLYVRKNEYFIGMSFVGGEKYTPQIIFRKSEKPILTKKEGLNGLKKILDENEKNFGKDTFKDIMENIFKIFGEYGAETTFDYDFLIENIKKTVQ